MMSHAVRAVFALLLFIPVPALAQTTWHVDDDACPGTGTGTELDPFCSIQAAIDRALDGDEIVVAPGTYNEVIDLQGKAVYLHSSDGAAVTTIDGADIWIHIVTCDDGEGPDTIIEGFTMSFSGGSPWGCGTLGAIMNMGSSPTIRRCVFTDYHRYGIVNIDGGATVTDCEFNGIGGGIWNENHTGVIERCVFTGQHCADVKIIRGSTSIVDSVFLSPVRPDFLHDSVVEVRCAAATISRCSFTGLDAPKDPIFGGVSAILNTGCDRSVHDPQPLVVVEESAFTRNNVTGCGTVANSSLGHMAINRCQFIENTSSGDGGAVCCTGHSTTSIDSCEFYGNAAQIHGGGIYKQEATVGVRHSTFVGNWSGWFGPAIKDFLEGWVYPLTVSNCTFVANDGYRREALSSHTGRLIMNDSVMWANSGGDLFVDLTEGVVTFSLIEQGFEGAGNSQSDPMFVRMPDDGGDGWADDPETPDVDERDSNDYGDLRLLPGSPCINAGDPTVGWSVGQADLDGHRRVLCSRIDMGAFEFGIGDFFCDGVVDVSDLAKWSACASGPDVNVEGETCGAFDFNADGAIDLSDFAGFQTVVESP